MKVTSVLHELPPPRTGRSGRPRTRGARLGTPADVAALATTTNTWRATRVRRYGRTDAVQITERVCLWYGSFRSRTVRVILVRDDKPRTRGRDDRGYGLPLVTTDLESSAEDLVARYAARWGIEQAFADARQIMGVGEARNSDTPCRRADGAIRADLLQRRHPLVCAARARPRGRDRPPDASAVVHHEDRTVLRRHDHQTPPCHHRRQISRSTP